MESMLQRIYFDTTCLCWSRWSR